MSQDELYIDKCRRTGQCLLGFASWLKPVMILVYGSVARGHIGVSSDIDILVVSENSPLEMPSIRKNLLRELPAFVDGEFPYADIKITALDIFENPDNSEYGDYIRNCKKEGIVIWKRE